MIFVIFFMIVMTILEDFRDFFLMIFVTYRDDFRDFFRIFVTFGEYFRDLFYGFRKFYFEIRFDFTFFEWSSRDIRDVIV